MRIFFLFLLTKGLFAFQIKGDAFVNGKLLYVEVHEVELNSDGSYKKLKTTYLNGKKFAEIESDFSKNLHLPNSIFYDERFNLKEIISLEDKNLSIKRSLNGKTTEGKVNIEENMIVGQGFHNFIVKNFDQILNSTKDISMIVPAKFDYYRFQIRVTNKDADNVELTVRPNNFLLKQLVEKIVLKYEIKSKRLLKFSGPSNLDSDKGEGQNVEIKYYY